MPKTLGEVATSFLNKDIEKKDMGRKDSFVKLNSTILRTLRLQRNYTLETLGKLSGLSTSYLSRLEAGARRMNTEIIHKLSLALGCNPDDFFKNVNEISFSQENGYFKDVPVYRVIPANVAAANNPLAVIALDEVMEYTFRLPQLAYNENIFAIFASAKSERFDVGDVLYFENREIKEGDYVVIVDSNNYLFTSEVESLDNCIKLKNIPEIFQKKSIKQASVLVASIYA